MGLISWDKNSYMINGRPEFLICGEFHYFRVPQKDWQIRLKLFKEAGGNCVATYIPWILHEPNEGDFRLGDIPERDLEGFLTLCQEIDILVICRPGPYQYSELRYDGLPGWLCEKYPQIQAIDAHGKPFRKSSVSYLHPLFLEKAKKWLDYICPVIARHTVAKGGAVAFVQFDNELMGIHEWFSSGLDYHPVTMGFGEENGRFAGFLHHKYQDIENLNLHYQTKFTQFKDVRPFTGPPHKLTEQRRIKDYQDFYFSTVAEYAALLVSWFRESGIDCDLVHNSANPNMNSYFLETVSWLKTDFILGSDHYYNLDQDWEGNNPTPKYAMKVFYSLEMLRLMGFPPTVFELPGGSCSDWPPITQEDLKCCYMVNLAFGMKGLNYYVFTGGPNPENIGANGDSYDYNASVGADGSIRPHYQTQKNFGAFLKANSWLTRADKMYDINLGLDWEHTRSSRYTCLNDVISFSNAEAWSFLQKGLIITSLCASYSPRLLDLRNDSLIQTTDKPLLIASSACMAADIQKRLVAFLKNGGRLLLSPVIPTLDENFQPCTILAEFLGGASVEPCPETCPRVNVGAVQNVLSNIKLFKSNLPSGAVSLSTEEQSGSIAAWKKTFPGKGMAIWLGLAWKHSKREHSGMLKYLLHELNCHDPIVDCDNPNVWTSLFSNGKYGMLFIMNLFSAPMQARIKVQTKNGENDLGCHQLLPMEVKALDCNL